MSSLLVEKFGGKTNNSREISITWLRGIATIMVVVLHVAAIEYYKDPSPLRFFMNTVNSFMRLCVPLFAMISGYLLWSKQTESFFYIAFKRFWHIFQIIAYFSIIGYIIEKEPKTYTLFESWKIFFATYDNDYGLGVLWYMFAILPIYTLTPFISLPRNKDQKFYIKLSILLIFMFFITENIKVPPFNIKTEYSLNMMLLYFLLGFSIGNIKFSVKKSWIFLFIYIVTSGIMAINLEWANSGLYVLIQALAFFIFIRSLNFEKILSTKIGNQANNILKLFAKYSIGVYGWHHIILNYVYYQKLKYAKLEGSIIISITIIITLLGALVIAMLDYHFWHRVNKWLSRCYQSIKDRLFSLTKKI